MATERAESPALRVGRILHEVGAEGPGLRTAVWVQGCSIRCRGCINPELFDARGGTDAAPEDIVRDALAAGAEGFTLLGGEPLDQPEAIGELARQAQAAGLGVICFTGYRHEVIAARPEAATLLRHTDLLVDGEYQQQHPETRRTLVGSSNQRFIHLTDRYRDRLPAEGERRKNRVELRIGPDGAIQMAGFLTREGVGEWAEAMESRRRPRA